MKRKLWFIPASIFLVAFVYRLLYVIPIDVELTSDMKGYVDSALSFLRGEELAMREDYLAYRPPLYGFLLAVCFAILGEHYTAVRVVQAFIGAATAVVVFFVVLRLLDDGRRDRPASVREALTRRAWLTATLAALAVAVFDSLVFYCGEFLTETWYIFFLLVLIYHLMTGGFAAGGEHRKGYGAALLSGGILGLMALLRPAALFLTPPILVVERKRGAAWRSLGLTLFAAAFVIHPWTLRNAVLLRAFVPISTNTGVNLYIGHNPHFGYWSTGNKEGIRQATDLDEVEESRYFMRLAIEYAVSHPWRTAKNTLVKFYNLYRFPWTPSFLVRSEDDRIRSYKPWPWPGNGAPLRFAGIGWLPTIEWGLPFFIVFLLGLLLSFRDRARFLLLHLFILFHTLGYMVFFGRTRFAVPMMPLCCIFAAYGLMRVLAWSRLIRFTTAETDDPPYPPYEGGQKEDTPLTKGGRKGIPPLTKGGRKAPSPLEGEGGGEGDGLSTDGTDGGRTDGTTADGAARRGG